MAEEPVKKPILPKSVPPTPGPPEKDLKALTPIQIPRTPDDRVDPKALTPIQMPRKPNVASDLIALTPIQLPHPPIPEEKNETVESKRGTTQETDRKLRKRKP
jgi:hypothetical protein